MVKSVQNYDELDIVTDCMSESDDFNTYYSEPVEDTMSDVVTLDSRYLWHHHCDPCTEGDA